MYTREKKGISEASGGDGGRFRNEGSGSLGSLIVETQRLRRADTASRRVIRATKNDCLWTQNCHLVEVNGNSLPTWKPGFSIRNDI
jgi:hypothetical protein